MMNVMVTNVMLVRILCVRMVVRLVATRMGMVTVYELGFEARHLRRRVARAATSGAHVKLPPLP
jgi:hypothetical protein